MQKSVAYNRPVRGDARARRVRQVSMPINSDYLFVVNMDVDADKEAHRPDGGLTRHVLSIVSASSL